jgi:catechol 2,3-dioxygenase-like lactoylglutathione lyase family enzyme
MAELEEYTFGHIHVFCTDLEKTERWFVDGLGAEFVTKRDSRGTPGVELRLGGQQILLRGARDGEKIAPAGARHFGTDHFGLDVKDVDGVVERLRGRGVEIEVEPWEFRPGTRIAFVKGPDNVRIELVQRTP